MVDRQGGLVCPAVLDSLCSHVQSQQGLDMAMTAMMTVPTMRDSAFELLVLMSLRQFAWGSLDTVRCGDGVRVRLNLTVNQTVRLQRGPLDLLLQPEPGTLLQCYDGHHVLDAYGPTGH